MRFQLITLALSLISIADSYTDTKKRKFPDGFLFGVASAAYQVEGGWNEDGKGESIWDRFMHTKTELADVYNGDVAADSYHFYKRDVEMLRELGVDFYRFSVSWSRVLPSGLSNDINKAGLQFYHNLIDELLKYNIEPMVTMYHFDLPQFLQDLGGWANPLSVIWFEDYARVLFDAFGHKVKYWVTINQPNSICIDGYSSDFAPGVKAHSIAGYICIKNVLLAHARAYRLYEKEYKNKFQGSVGISLALNWIDPFNNKTENAAAAEKARAFALGLYLDPIWSETGDFPRNVKEVVAKKSKEQGFSKSRLPVLTPEEIKLLKGSADFLGMNHYTTFLVKPIDKKSEIVYDAPSYLDDVGVEFSQGEKWKQGKSTWLKSAPYGIYKACLHINLNYNYPTIIITENGWSTGTGLRDPSRVEYIRSYLSALLLAMEDGTELKGYTAWSLLDNVEWNFGTSERFGLYEVDFTSPNKTRSARLSALVYKHIIESRVTDDEWTTNNLRIRISDRRRPVKNEL